MTNVVDTRKNTQYLPFFFFFFFFFNVYNTWCIQRKFTLYSYNVKEEYPYVKTKKISHNCVETVGLLTSNFSTLFQEKMGLGY